MKGRGGYSRVLSEGKSGWAYGIISCLRYHKPFSLRGLYGGDDGARTRDLCRDRKSETRNLQKLDATDGHFWRY